MLTRARTHMKRAITIIILAAALAFQGCMKVDEVSSPRSQRAQLGFDITVTRVTGATKGTLVDGGEMISSMDHSRPFSLIAVEQGTGSLLMDNAPVYSGHDGKYALSLDGGILEIPSQILFSAYYPHVASVEYESSMQSYSIPFAATETEAGPLVSKTVQRSINQLNTLPLEFCHITNDIGFKVCDITPDNNLQGLIHLRKLTAYNVASAGIYLNDISLGRGDWTYQGYLRNVVVFEGDALVGVGSGNERFVGKEELVNHMNQSTRFYAIPDEIQMGRQYVEAIFDVDGFYIGEEYYAPLKDQMTIFSIYGVLPGNVMVPGKQYTFHLGLDLGTVYQQITFSPSISGWQNTNIYEDNQDF